MLAIDLPYWAQSLLRVLGGTVAVLLLPVLLLLVPLFDTAFVTVARTMAGRSVAQGGRDHTSHRLVALGLSERGAVLIVPMLDVDTVLLIREYAAGVQRYELALPKGRIEPGEDLIKAANREIMEEIGQAAHTLRHITSLTVAPGYLSHTTHVILAQDLYPCKALGDEPEEIEVVPWKLSQLNELLQCDDCTEARSIAALFMVKELLKNDR